MNDVQRALNEYYYYILAGGFAFGLLVGVVLFFLAARRGKKSLGIAALVISLIAGISPLLVIIAAIVFLFLIFRSAAPQADPDGSADNSETEQQ